MNRRKKLYSFLLHPNSIASILLCLCLLAGWKLLSQFGANSLEPSNVIQFINQLGFLGKLAYISILALAIVISPIPGTPITVAAGAIWGPLIAGIYGVVGIFLGSLIAYFLGRTLGRTAVQMLTGKTIYLSKHKGEAYLGWVVFVTHCLPIMPFDLVSYGAGLSRLSFKIYALSTLLGTIPCTFFLTYMGASLIVKLPVGIAITVVFLTSLLALAWGVRKHNWLGIKDIIRIE